MIWEDLIYILPAVLFAIVIHETAHGFVSFLLGDPTPKREGRLTLNPLRHLDPVGTVCLIVFGFGWAKPVHVDAHYYRNPKLGMVWVALAGPAVNFLAAFLIGIIFFVLPDNAGLVWLYKLLYYFMLINTGLALFNLIPVPPLDGSKIIGALIPEKYYYTYLRFEKFGIIFLLILLATGLLNNFLNQTMQGYINLIEKTAAWLIEVIS